MFSHLKYLSQILRCITIEESRSRDYAFTNYVFHVIMPEWSWVKLKRANDNAAGIDVMQILSRLTDGS